MYSIPDSQVKLIYGQANVRKLFVRRISFSDKFQPRDLSVRISIQSRDLDADISQAVRAQAFPPVFVVNRGMYT